MYGQYCGIEDDLWGLCNKSGRGLLEWGRSAAAQDRPDNFGEDREKAKKVKECIQKICGGGAHKPINVLPVSGAPL